MERPKWERLLKFRCTGCGNCCKQTYICVTDTDVRRLMDGTGRRAEEIVRFAREDEINLGKHHPWWVRFANRRGVMVLRWKRGRCTFLAADIKDFCMERNIRKFCTEKSEHFLRELLPCFLVVCSKILECAV